MKYKNLNKLQQRMFTSEKFSPYKRSYQFMHLQNSAYHLRNKRKAKSIVDTNLSKKENGKFMEQVSRRESKLKAPHRYSKQKDMGLQSSSSIGGLSFSLRQPHRVIHKHEVFERAKSAKINRENMKFVSKLIDTDCMVVSRSRAAESYQRHRKYVSLIRKYQENGERHVIPVLNLDKLSPALSNYRSFRALNERKRKISQSASDGLVFDWPQ